VIGQQHCFKNQKFLGCSGCSAPFGGRRLLNGEEVRARRLKFTTKDWRQSVTISAAWLICPTLMGRTRAADESRVVESELNRARFEVRPAVCGGCSPPGSLPALRSRHSDAPDSSCPSQDCPPGGLALAQARTDRIPSPRSTSSCC
jgi:hypothetical protein